MKYIPAEIFRAYDIRGVVGETLTPEYVYDIGYAIAKQTKKIVVARDGRLSGPMLMTALQAGLLAGGCDVVDIGAVPTPVLYFATEFLKIPSGIMMTGSHNPINYNGLKIILHGIPLYGEAIQALYQDIMADAIPMERSLGVCITQDIESEYLQAIQARIILPALDQPMKVVVDAGNGITGRIAPLLYQALGCEVIPLYCEIDGHFPNHHPDPGQPQNLQDLAKRVQETGAQLGLAFDGDGDRLGIVDEQGHMIYPDRALILFAQELLTEHPGAKIIFDVKCTQHVARSVLQYGGVPVMWKTGHSFIKAKMREITASLAGEMSGHLFFADWYGFDDALYAGARLLKLLAKANPRTLSMLFKAIPDSQVTPELHIPVLEAQKFAIVTELSERAAALEGQITTLDGIRIDFTDGFGLIRASNTTPNLILRFEGDTVHALTRIQTVFRELIHSVLPETLLPF
jgi:phosphomannomutase/phosphoglucomutase